MSKVKLQFFCSNCNQDFNKWHGQCPECNSWDCIKEFNNNIEISNFHNKKITQNAELITVSNIGTKKINYARIKTNFTELDQALGGGIVNGSVILIGGDPGVGKSTLILQILNQLASEKYNCLYVSGEESEEQINLRARRLEIKNSYILVSTNNNVISITNYIKNVENKPKLVIIDSIQTSYIDELGAVPGSVTQVRNSVLEFTSLAKKNNISLILIGHVTKEGQLAGPKLIEHMVDVVLYFEGDKNNNMRILRSHKNRYGATNELAIFDMEEKGLKEITNPSEIFLEEYNPSEPGCSIFALNEGSRTILIELQSLLSPSFMANPRRAVNGWDQNRLAIILAVLTSKCNLNFNQTEVYFNVIGGLKISEPAADLAAAASLISALRKKPLPQHSIIFGEIGLSGEIRNSGKTEQRLDEAEKLGFKTAIIPKQRGKKKIKTKLQLIEIDHISKLLKIIS
jgi:DNA repair protein RadA/Sms